MVVQRPVEPTVSFRHLVDVPPKAPGVNRAYSASGVHRGGSDCGGPFGSRELLAFDFAQEVAEEVGNAFGLF
jgi:hypothetical protein